MTEKKHALYLYKDGESVRLFHADDVDQAKADGWKEPTFRKSNGEEWNDAEGDAARDAAAEVEKTRAELDAKKAAEKAKADEKERAAIEAARAEAASEPDVKVQIVEPAKAGSTARKSSK